MRVEAFPLMWTCSGGTRVCCCYYYSPTTTRKPLSNSGTFPVEDPNVPTRHVFGGCHVYHNNSRAMGLRATSRRRRGGKYADIFQRQRHLLLPILDIGTRRGACQRLKGERGRERQRERERDRDRNREEDTEREGETEREG